MLNRVNLSFPEKRPDFNCSLSVRVSDINYGDHLGNDRLVAYLHEARVLFLKELGYTEFNIEGIGIIQADLMVRYVNEGFLGDMLTCSIFTTGFTARSFEMFYLLRTIRDGVPVEIARAKVGLVCYDHVNKVKADVPRAFIRKIGLIEKSNNERSHN